MKWAKIRLGDIAIVSSSKRIFARQYTNQGIPFYRQKEIIDKKNKVELSDVLYISQETYDEIKSKFGAPQKGDLLITAVGVTLGIPYVVGDEVFYFKDGNLIWLREFDDSADSTYIYYWIASDLGKKAMWSRTIGSAQPALTIDTIKQFEIPFPPIKTQRRIASILSAYDDLIENNQKQIKLLEEAAQRLYKEWFVDLRFPGHENVKIVDGVPEGWSYKPLSDLFSFVRGKSYTSKELSDTSGVLMVNLKNIRAFGGYKRNAEKRFTGKYKKEQSLNPGDLVMGVTDMTQERRLVGHSAIVPDLGEPMTLSMDLIKLVPTNIQKSYLYSTLYYGGFSLKISPLANGVNVLHLKPEAMMNLQMLVPTRELMDTYVKVFDPIQSRIELLQKQIDVAAEARDRLLPKLMSGEIEV